LSFETAFENVTPRGIGCTAQKWGLFEIRKWREGRVASYTDGHERSLTGYDHVGWSQVCEYALA